MNNLHTAALSFANILKIGYRKQGFTRNLWYMTKNFKRSGFLDPQVFKTSVICSCGSNIHTKGERELVEFLTEEILAERKVQKHKTLPTKLDEFDVKLDGAEVELTKESDKEKILVNFNVNHSVDAENETEIDPNANKPELGEMHSKPQFEVDIIRGFTKVSFTCSFLHDSPQEGDYNDVFAIDEFCIYDKEWNDKIYAVSGDVLDGYLYDLLMNLLEEKGITNEFVEKLSDLATAHEHNAYITLLERLSKFIAAAK